MVATEVKTAPDLELVARIGNHYLLHQYPPSELTSAKRFFSLTVGLEHQKSLPHVYLSAQLIVLAMGEIEKLGCEVSETDFKTTATKVIHNETTDITFPLEGIFVANQKTKSMF
jgi:hypothetical protein